MADLHPDNPYAPERFANLGKPVEFPPEARQKFDYILTRYPTKEAYVAKVKQEAAELVSQRLLLPADATRLIAEAEQDGILRGP